MSPIERALSVALNGIIVATIVLLALDLNVHLKELKARVDEAESDLDRIGAKLIDHTKPSREPELAKALTKCQEQRANWEKKARGE